MVIGPRAGGGGAGAEGVDAAEAPASGWPASGWPPKSLNRNSGSTIWKTSHWPRATARLLDRQPRAEPNQTAPRAAARANAVAADGGGVAVVAAKHLRPPRDGSPAGRRVAAAAAMHRDRVHGRIAADDGTISRLSPAGLMKTTKVSSFSGSRRPGGPPKDPATGGQAPPTRRLPRAASTPSARCPAGWRRSASSSPPISTPATSRPAAASSLRDYLSEIVRASGLRIWSTTQVSTTS